MCLQCVRNVFEKCLQCLQCVRKVFAMCLSPNTEVCEHIRMSHVSHHGGRRSLVWPPSYGATATLLHSENGNCAYFKMIPLVYFSYGRISFYWYRCSIDNDGHPSLHNAPPNWSNDITISPMIGYVTYDSVWGRRGRRYATLDAIFRNVGVVVVVVVA